MGKATGSPPPRRSAHTGPARLAGDTDAASRRIVALSAEPDGAAARRLLWTAVMPGWMMRRSVWAAAAVLVLALSLGTGLLAAGLRAPRAPPRTVIAHAPV